MSRLTRATSPVALVLAVLALALAIGAGSAFAAAQIGTAQLKNGAVTNAKLANNAVTGAKVRNGSLTTADLAPSSVTSLRGKPLYWAYVTQAGAVGRGTPGTSAEAQLNGGFWQYRVTFPRDVSGCGYQVSSGDNAALGSNEYVIPALIGVARSTQGPRTLVVNVYDLSGNSIQDTFFVAVTC